MFDDLPDYLEWANARAAEMLAQTPSAECARIFAHLLAVESIWAERIAGLPPSCPQRPDWDLARCLKQIPVSVVRYREIIAPRRETAMIAYRNSQGEEFHSSVSEILFHVFAHGAYHRGQISQAVRNAGGEITDTDYILFRRQYLPPSERENRP